MPSLNECHLYASDVRTGATSEYTSLAREVPRITKDEVENALKGTKRGKDAGDEGINASILKDKEISYWNSLVHHSRNA